MVLAENISRADSVLEGEIVSFETTALSYSETSANLFQVTIVVNVKLIDVKNNKNIFENKNISFTDEYETDSGDFFSQETESLISVSEKIASSIVTTILENF